MSKLQVSQGVPAEYNRQFWTLVLISIESQLNGLSEGRMAQRYQALTAVPTTGSYAQGDRVWDSAPVEAGSAGSKYVRLGWVNVLGGTPGTFKEMRVLTGN